MGPLLHAKKLWSVVAYRILVSAQGPLVLTIGTWLGFGIGGLGTKGLGTGLDNIMCKPYIQAIRQQAKLEE